MIDRGLAWERENDLYNRYDRVGKEQPMAFEYVIEGNYGYGWEDICSYPFGVEGKKEALDDLQAYRENEPEYEHRLKTRKV